MGHILLLKLYYKLFFWQQKIRSYRHPLTEELKVSLLCDHVLLQNFTYAFTENYDSTNDGSAQTTQMLNVLMTQRKIP